MKDPAQDAYREAEEKPTCKSCVVEECNISLFVSFNLYILFNKLSLELLQQENDLLVFLFLHGGLQEFSTVVQLLFTRLVASSYEVFITPHAQLISKLLPNFELFPVFPIHG